MPLGGLKILGVRMMNKDKNCDKRVRCLTEDDEGQHMADIVSLSRKNLPINSMKKYVSDLDDCLVRFIKTFGEPE